VGLKFNVYLVRQRIIYVESSDDFLHLLGSFSSVLGAAEPAATPPGMHDSRSPTRSIDLDAQVCRFTCF
jgi:hypothetical protein